MSTQKLETDDSHTYGTHGVTLTSSSSVSIPAKERQLRVCGAARIMGKKKGELRQII